MASHEWVFFLIVLLAAATVTGGNFLAGSFNAPYQSAQPLAAHSFNWVGWLSLIIIMIVILWIAIKKL